MAKIYFVSRHPGAVDWALAHGIQFDVALPHLTSVRIQAGDVVLGTLPVHLAADVCAQGGSYHHLSMQLPAELRGQELTAEQMESFGAALQHYTICLGTPTSYTKVISR